MIVVKVSTSSVAFRTPPKGPKSIVGGRAMTGTSVELVSLTEETFDDMSGQPKRPSLADRLEASGNMWSRVGRER